MASVVIGSTLLQSLRAEPASLVSHPFQKLGMPPVTTIYPWAARS